MPGHSSSLFILGVMILWFGWYGFNPGSQLKLINNSQVVANAAVTTTLSPAFASLSALLCTSAFHRLKRGAPCFAAFVRQLICTWQQAQLLMSLKFQL